MKTLFIKKIILEKFFLLFLIFTSPDCFAQGNRGLPIFMRYPSGRILRQQPKKFDVHGIGRLIYRDSTLTGQLSVKNDSIEIKNERGAINKYAYSDTAIQSLMVKVNDLTLTLVRIKEFKNKLFRLIKDTLGMKVYDKNITYTINSNTIDYSYLLFQKDMKYMEAETFWTTSTKKNIIRILNQLLGLNLNPKKFKGKEDVLDKLLKGEEGVYSKR